MDSDSDNNFCTIQDISIGSDLDSDPLIEINRNRDLSLGQRYIPKKGYSNHLGKGSESKSKSQVHAMETCST